MSDDDMCYMELIEHGDMATVLIAFVTGGVVTSYVLRDISPGAVSALVCDMDTAIERGESCEAVADAWTRMES
jgi:hypothetical protein